MRSLRVFVGLDLPGELKEAIAKVKVELEPYIDGRWLTPQNLHLTLKFIGQVSPEVVEKISEQLDKVKTAFKPFLVQTTGFGFFPHFKKPRIFWLGLSNQQLTELAATIEDNLEKIGIPKEKRAFQPHITLVRFKKPVTIAADFEQKLPKLNLNFYVQELILFKSTLTPAGAEYTKLKKFALKT